jgi:hypothetical protein
MGAECTQTVACTVMYKQALNMALLIVCELLEHDHNGESPLAHKQ